MIGPFRARIIARFAIVLSYIESRGTRKTVGVCGSISAIGPCFISAAE